MNRLVVLVVIITTYSIPCEYECKYECGYEP